MATSTRRKLDDIFGAIDASMLSREEFVTTVENVLGRLLKVEKANSDIADLLKTTMENVREHLRGSSEEDFGKFKAETLSEIGMLSSKLDTKSQQIDQKMALIKDGIDGVSPDPEILVREVLNRIKLPEYRAPIMDGPQEIRDKLELLQDEERLDKKAIRGIEKIEEDIKQISLRPTGRVGGAKGIGLYTGGIKRLLTAQQINIVAGTGISVSYAYANGRNDITISASGTVALSPIAMTGDINDTNVDFVADSEPTLVVVNGQALRHGAGVTISGTTITLNSAVGTGGDIYGL